MAEEWRKNTLQDCRRKKELEENKRSLATLDAFSTDDENDEEEHEAWKVRELKRIKRWREDQEALEKEKVEIEHRRNLTEEERQAEFQANGKIITNKAVKANTRFYKSISTELPSSWMRIKKSDKEDKENRDFSAPTLEDHFNKTILPKVMQVKNFGRSVRNKYTYLVDQGTTYLTLYGTKRVPRTHNYLTNSSRDMRYT